MFKRYLVFILTIFLAGCYIVPKGYMTTYGTYNHQDTAKLKISGYYYCIDSVTYHGEPMTPRISWFIMYQDGTLLQAFQKGGEYTNLIDFEEKHFNNPPEYYDFHTFDKKANTWWGSYSIEDSIITFQYFVFFNNWAVVERKGEIINDKEIFVYSSKSFDRFYADGSEKYIHDVFKFKEFENKPDSLNWMMFDKYYN